MMDYQEAIDVLTNEIGCVDLDTNNRGYIDESEQKFIDACNTAISAMNELQLYKDGKLCLIPESVYSKQCTELDAYKQLGTLEEVVEAVEKQKAKKPIYKHYENAGEPQYVKVACPNGCRIQLHPVTDKHHAYEHDYCPKCGQSIDWSGEDKQ